jgi:hypothetical protein
MDGKERVIPGSGGGATCGRLQLFLIFLVHPERGLMVGGVRVSCKAGGRWQTEWDIGTIDKDPRLSDDWFCQDQYEDEFKETVQAAANECEPGGFELPGATSRWGVARGMRRENAMGLAIGLVALWEEILVEWGRHRC